MKKATEHLPVLNLPAFEPEICVTSGGVLSIRDNQRGKYVALTPEEWVRQHFVRWLTGVKGYPESLVINEVGLTVNGRQRRADTVVYSRNLRPLMIVEYKRASVAVTQKVFDQIVRYNMTFLAPYITVSNGLCHYCCRIDFDRHTYSFLTDIPDYSEL